MRKPIYPWEAIKEDFENLPMTSKAIAEKHGVKYPSSISKRARAEKWKKFKGKIPHKKGPERGRNSSKNKKKNSNLQRFGNKAWMARSSHGSRPIFENPNDLWKAAVEYFEWVHSTPIEEPQIFCHKGFVIKDKKELLRPMSLEGLYLFIGIVKQTFHNYSEKDEFKEVIEKIKMVIKTQKFEGAAVGIFNANIIARDIGLVDKKEVEIIDIVVGDDEE